MMKWDFVGKKNKRLVSVNKHNACVCVHSFRAFPTASS